MNENEPLKNPEEDSHGRIIHLQENEYRIEFATAVPETAEKLTSLGFTQDPDVLDTWFSSWLWPFATMGWPEKTDTLAKFYPTTDLVTGPDIIFFWVARMIMAGYEWMGEMPFRNVYFTSIIRDKQGRKLSKSLGNSPDPLELIAKFGADGLRFGTMRSAPLGQDVTYDEKNVELGRNFCTKLWNAARFRQMQGGESEAEINPRLLTVDDKWIIMRLDRTVKEVSLALDEFRFSDATTSLYRFFWNEFCDWYLEASKAGLNSGDEGRKGTTLAVLDFVLSHTLRLFHPFLPFITEELWHGLGYSEDMPSDQGGRTIMTAPWPKPLSNDERHYMDIDPSHEDSAQERYDVVNAGRGLRRDFNIASSKRVRFVLRGYASLAPHDHAVLQLLLGADPLELVTPEWQAPKGTPIALTPLGELMLPLEGLVDVAAERERLGKEIAKVEQELAKVRAKLADTNFAAKVPAQVLNEHREREEAWAQKLAQLQRMQEALS
jgi:valyl-tRNA synthetase